VPRLALVILAAGLGTRFGGPKQLTPVGPDGSVIFDYTAHDALGAGFDTVVLVTRTDLEDSVRQHIRRTWPDPGVALVVCQDADPIALGARAAGRRKPLGTAHAVFVGMAALGPHDAMGAHHVVPADAVAVANGDVLYGAEPLRLLADALQSSPQPRRGSGSPSASMPGQCVLVTYPMLRTVIDDAPVKRALCTVRDEELVDIEEGTVAGQAWTGSSGRLVPLRGDEPTSMNLWGFGSAWSADFESASRTLAAMGETEQEALLPDVVRERLVRGAWVTAIRWSGPSTGLTHADDTARLRRMLTRPAWS
jgi:hypothetical protein